MKDLYFSQTFLEEIKIRLHLFFFKRNYLTISFIELDDSSRFQNMLIKDCKKYYIKMNYDTETKYIKYNFFINKKDREWLIANQL